MQFGGHVGAPAGVRGGCTWRISMWGHLRGEEEEEGTRGGAACEGI